MSEDGPSVGEIIRALRADGMSKAAIARALGVSPRLLTFGESGDKPLSNLLAPLSDLLNFGQVRKPPKRRQAKTGTLVPVRAKKAVTAATGRKSVPPPAPLPAPKRGKYGVARTRGESGRQFVKISAPKTPGPGRAAAGADMLQAIRDAAANGRSFTAVFTWRKRSGETGTARLGDKGAYDAGTVLRKIESEFDGDVFAWIASVYEFGVYEEAIGPGGRNVIGMDLDL